MQLFKFKKRKKTPDEAPQPRLTRPKQNRREQEEKKVVSEKSGAISSEAGVTKKAARALRPGAKRIDESREGGEVFAHIIKNPRITEKASFITEDGGYTFDVDERANKVEIKKAVEEIYNVKPIRVNVINIPSKRVMVRNKPGVKYRGKKAIVYLKEGDRIEFV